MRNADTVLGVIRQRGERGLPITDLYRQLFNPELYLRAYARLSANAGALTPGSTPDTVDGMSLVKIDRLIADLRAERHRWTPVRRTYLPKPNGKQRPLGIPTWTDKLLQEALRLILDAYYEPQFSDRSHGFRPGRGCHTALHAVQRTWTGTKWFVEGDIKGAFDHIDHAVLLSILGEKILDNRFLRLIQQLLQAGYLEDWRYHQTLSGTPQGGVVSPILANIYLDQLDQFVARDLLPAYNRQEGRQRNPAYTVLRRKVQTCGERGRFKEAAALRKQAQQLPSKDPTDPQYRRLRYIRYADDWLLGFVGPKAEAEEIKRRIGVFLRETLKLELSEEKTLITHAASQAARFLGYDIVVQHADDRHDRHGRRTVNGIVGLRVPAEVVATHCAAYMRHGKPVHRPERTKESDFAILTCYQAEYRGIVQYYALAQNVAWFYKLRWVMETSLLKTLAAKFKATVTAMARKYRATAQTASGPLKCLEVVVARGDGRPPLVARFGGFPLHRQTQAILNDRSPLPRRPPRSELLQRLLAEECELCGAVGRCEVHHVRKLADLRRPGRAAPPPWIKAMIALRRKTLIVCASCHAAIHAGRPVPTRRSA
jgi:group II intron reverse transcriptase/maturase